MNENLYYKIKPELCSVIATPMTHGEYINNIQGDFLSPGTDPNTEGYYVVTVEGVKGWFEADIFESFYNKQGGK